MRKILTAFLIVFAILLPFAFSEEMNSIAEFEKMVCIDRMLNAEKSVSVVRIFYDAEGGELFSVFVYADRDEEGRFRYVYEDSEGNVEILSEDGCIGFDAWSMEMYVPVFLMDEYDLNIEILKENFFCDAMLNEKIVSDTVEDGKRVVTTVNETGLDEAYAKIIKYTFDESDGKLIEVSDAYRTLDGASELISRSYISYGEVYEASEAFKAVREPEIVREIEIITVADEERETQVFTVAADVNVTFIYPEEYTLYSDETLTRMFVGEEKDENGLYPLKTVIYMGELR